MVTSPPSRARPARCVLRSTRRGMRWSARADDAPAAPDPAVMSGDRWRSVVVVKRSIRFRDVASGLVWGVAIALLLAACGSVAPPPHRDVADAVSLQSVF